MATTLTEAPPRVTAAKRTRLEAELALVDTLDTLGIDDLDPINGIYACRWEYKEPRHHRELSTEDRRAAALEWLARHTRAVQAIARQYGVKVAKVANDHQFGVCAYLTDTSPYLSAEAFVPAALTCEMVYTGRTEQIPAQVKPVMERVCPPSIFAGIQDDVLDTDEVHQALDGSAS